MAQPALTPTQSTIQKALRAFLLNILPPGIEVIEGQDNKVPEPQSTDFVTMTMLRRPRLATNIDTLNTEGNQYSIKQPTLVVVQLDVHSTDMATASDNAQLISTLFRDQFAVSFFKAYSGISPLYADDPRQVPFQNAEEQWESRYVIEVHLQVDQTVTVPAQSATSAKVGLVPVDNLPV